MRNRLYIALAAYTAIAVLAVFTLQGQFRIAVLILMAGFAVRTWLATKAQK